MLDGCCRCADVVAREKGLGEGIGRLLGFKRSSLVDRFTDVPFDTPTVQL